ncbi:MAG: 3,4-dihydroxy-2-butanone-4-phosphate synthase [Nitrososphaerales archaeon]|nr:3,4-dihydroxy-2-butanone-4-phosphate synthase [Nitrososphaerales archaeon]
MTEQASMDEIIKNFQNGEFIFLHDDDSRENETDIMLAAKHVTPQKINQMRQLGGGLLCVAISPDIGSKLKLPYMWDILLQTKSPSLTSLVNTQRNTNQRSTHSITFNHRTLGGATDSQRSDTISSLHKLCEDYTENHNFYDDFHSMFESPGHLQMLIGSPGLLGSREGHTELSLFLCNISNLTPIVIMCEILDNKSFKEKSVANSKSLANENSITFIEAGTILDYYKNNY